MTKATNVYIIMLATFAGGIYVTLEIGGLLKAPEDLAGRWQLAHATAASTHPTTGPSDGPTLVVGQSGRFFELQADNGQLVAMKLTSAGPADERSPERLRLALADGNTTAVFQGMTGGDDFALHVDAPAGSPLAAATGDWFAKRTVRTYPINRTSAQGGH